MWIPSKLSQPEHQNNTIKRPRILSLLTQAAQSKLVLLRSPAGYGKTTMVLDWLSQQKQVGWFSIDESDNDSYRFVNYLVRALNKATDNSCSNAQMLVERHQYASLTALFATLLSELDSFQQHAYLVLDDYHQIHNDELHEAMRFFLKHLSNHLTIVITSRVLPPLGTANLRVRDQMIEIDHQQLAFDVDETLRFMQQRVGQTLTLKQAQRLCDYIEGWPSALQLVALQTKQIASIDLFNALGTKELGSTHASREEGAIRSLPIDHSHLWDYLMEEVFARLDPPTQIFLMRSSVMEYFTANMASTITGCPDALGKIELLVRSGLFIWPMNAIPTHHQGREEWFRFHHLFAEFLCHQRKAKMADQESLLHSQATQAWLDEHNPNLALHHASIAQDVVLQTDILKHYGWGMFNQGALEALEHGINALDEDTLYREPTLCLMQAWLAQSQHRYDEVASLLEQADHHMQRLGVQPTEREQAEFNALKAQIAINQNQPELALSLAEQALSVLDGTIYQSRIVATSVVGEVNHVLGDLSRGLSMMQQTEKLARQYQVYPQALWAMAQQSEILLAQGYSQAAYDIQDTALLFIQEHQLQQLPLHEFLLRIRGQLLWCWNRLDEAQECAYKGLDVLGDEMNSKHLHCYSLLALIALTRGEMDKAGRFIDEVQQRLQTSTYHVDWTAHASLVQLLFWQHSDDLQSIQQWLDNTYRPEHGYNHFTQLQWRNITRAQMALGQYNQAQESLDFIQQEAKQYQLTTDLNRNWVVQAGLAQRQKKKALANRALVQALTLTVQNGMVGNYLLDSEELAPALEQVLHSSKLSDIARHRGSQLLKSMLNVRNKRSIHFDEDFIHQLMNRTDTPELIRTSPLTQREWQVLGLIYSGLSNEQIAQEMDVAGTTVKTHIRNLYQKLNIANRRQAITTAEKLVEMMGYA
ncbi:HTH-type transcriptional regulator MalT [Vibrio porteresiae]|uniref:HTH-type transcriptional regulator MalT n=1 Tax=Vibrio porteresiae DSM 19223 TaxID=1123496 RepID=A0ABZ0QJQ3_9VIBR|nr:HTH-type transcriptional regulator MalT [Vibrio porteresiae]WPC76738.1 HTH-type transcriptional regulator MalT [Vibrio porteresiae DSM 19223]